MDIPSFDFQNPEGDITEEFDKQARSLEEYIDRLITEKRAIADNTTLNWFRMALANSVANQFIVCSKLRKMYPDRAILIDTAILALTAPLSIVVSGLCVALAQEEQKKKAKSEIEKLKGWYGEPDRNSN